MATAWQTLEEAALTLGISSRTLHRRLARGEFETRLESGRREVLIALPEPLADVSDRTDTPDAPHEQPAEFVEQSQMHDEVSSDIASNDIGGTMLALHEDRIRRTDLAIMAYQQSVNVTASDARRAHRHVRLAWSVAGGLTVAMFLSVVWATHTVTKARGEVTHLSSVVRQLSDTADTRGRDVEQFRKDAESARLTAARIEGQLGAAQSRIDELRREKSDIEARLSATTQPASAQAAPAQPALALEQSALEQPALAATTQPIE